jgi:hypothetical protein
MSNSEYKSGCGELIDRRELARRLKVDPRTVYNLELKRIIPSLRIGRCVRYNWESVLKSFNSR